MRVLGLNEINMPYSDKALRLISSYHGQSLKTDLSLRVPQFGIQ